MKTYLPKVDLEQRKWHLIDANGAILGRLAVQVANILRGRNKPSFTPFWDTGDFVVIINAEKVAVSGKKETNKTFMSYSGWKGGEKFATVAEIRARHPEKLVWHAIKGMMPNNSLGKKMLTKVKIYKGSAHPHAAQNPSILTASN
jgi:large subunit ribosomal protein L13